MEFNHSTGKIVKVSGPLVIAEGMRDANMFDVVHVGEHNLIGEIIEMRGDKASIQVYEETAGIGPGDQVISTGAPLSVELGPGLIQGIFDGIQRPLEEIYKIAGPNITRGIQVPSLNRERIWEFTPVVKVGDHVVAGDILGTIPETVAVLHKVLVPVGYEGEIVEVSSGGVKVTDHIAVIRTGDKTIKIPLMEKCPVRRGRPVAQKLKPDIPMVTGQRIIDTFFPVSKGGTAAVPGPFGSGKTVVQHQLAKWADVDIVVYIGCGERGNEMTDVLREFPELVDPRTGESLMKRTVLIANTSDMPVAAREASIYTGITIAEYYRDMGYHVAIMADSTSRWAEALREMSGRLEEMPGEEGYPAYLTSRLAQFYERAGSVVCLGNEGRTGSLTAIGAVSPPGGDISEPVSQATLRIVKVFWGLDSTLAYARHFPAINWLSSYSLYLDTMGKWIDENIDAKWTTMRQTAMNILHHESELQEIVKLVGVDALAPNDRLVLEAARSIREDFLQQNAFDLHDAYSTYEKQAQMLHLIISYYELSKTALQKGADMEQLFSLAVREKIGRVKSVAQDEIQVACAAIYEELTKAIDSLTDKEDDLYA